MMNELFVQYDIVRGYYLDEIVQAYDGDITEIRYVSKYDETISVNILGDVYDKLFLDIVMMNYEEDYDIDYLAEKLTEMVETKVAELKGSKQIGTKTKAVKAVPEEPVMVPNNNMVIAKIQEQMIKAIEEGDFETYDKLEERLNRLNK